MNDSHSSIRTTGLTLSLLLSHIMRHYCAIEDALSKSVVEDKDGFQ